MILTGRVIEVKAGESSSDLELVTFAVSPGPGRSSAILTLPNDEGWQLDDPVEVSLSMRSASGIAVDQEEEKKMAS